MGFSLTSGETATTAGLEQHVALIRAAQAGDQESFERLVQIYEQPILRLARSLMQQPADAWDIYQETFTKVYTSLHKFRFECSFYTWVYRIATNACLDALRRKQVRRGVWAQWPSARDVGINAEGNPAHRFATQGGRSGADPERALLAQELRRRIQVALRELPPRERIVFTLRHDHGLKLRAIGQILRTSEATAKNALFRGTQKLRRELSDLMSQDTAAGRPRPLEDKS